MSLVALKPLIALISLRTLNSLIALISLTALIALVALIACGELLAWNVYYIIWLISVVNCAIVTPYRQGKLSKMTSLSFFHCKLLSSLAHCMLHTNYCTLEPVIALSNIVVGGLLI